MKSAYKPAYKKDEKLHKNCNKTTVGSSCTTSSNTTIEQPFALNFPFANPILKKISPLLEKPLEQMVGLHQLNRTYDLIPSQSTDFLAEALKALSISYNIIPEEIERIPKDSPVVIVGNHPFGGIEGVILGSILKKVRPDVKIMANFLLSRITELQDLFIFVDPFDKKTSFKKNIQPMRETVEWLNNGGALGVFPSGTVSHWHWDKREVRDPDWSNTVARVIRKTGASALPVYFEGRNSNLFQVMGIIHPLLRTAMLPRELLRQRSSQVEVRIGNLISNEKLHSYQHDEDLIAYLRLRTYLLGKGPDEQSRFLPRRPPALTLKKTELEPISGPCSSSLLANEIRALPANSCLLKTKEFSVYIAETKQIKNILLEIGRLRELTFRAVNEGTGRSRDIDKFDQHYIHLFLWNHEKQEIVGAYRLGLTDVILDGQGKKGLYTSTLFNYHSRLLEQLQPAIELGRSFIRTEYQKQYYPLLMLWQGIGQFVVQNPQYNILFGPVSINNEYDSVSKQLIVTFLRANSYIPHLAKLVKPKNPLRVRPIKGWHAKVVRDIDEVSQLVAEIEAGQREVPILLKQYLRLGGKLLGFNIDPDFGDVLDGLILVDLQKTPRRVLRRFMGAEGVQSFLASQNKT